MFVKEVKPRIIKNSRGERTVEIELETFRGNFISSAPSGKSKGSYETPAYNEKGIDFSLKLLKALCAKLKNKNFMFKELGDLEELEYWINKIERKYGRLGANVTYALETVFLKAAAKDRKKELWEFIKQGKSKIKMPMPVGNCIGGGVHSKGNKKPDFQEFLLIPNEKKFSRAITKNIDAYEHARTILKKASKKWIVRKNDESAWRTDLKNEDALAVMGELAYQYKLRVGIDAAASSFFEGEYYNYQNKRLVRDREEQIDFMNRLIQKFKLSYIEDPLHEEDFGGFAELRKANPNVMIIGDDLTVTNLERVQRAVKMNAINAMIVKPNQNGSILKTAEVVKFCKENKIKIIFSHRSGETMDDALADYAVGFGADFIKTGILGKERLIKMRRVMEIEKSLV